MRQKQGHLVEAQALAARTLHIRSQTLGETHPHTVASRELSVHLEQEQAFAEVEAASNPAPEGISYPCRNERHANGTSPSLHKANSLVENDPLQAFLSACCELHPRAWCRSHDLWQAYEQWADEQQEHYPLSRGAFIAQLKVHGCSADRTMSARIWRGITLVKPKHDGS